MRKYKLSIKADGWRATTDPTYGTPLSTDRWEIFDTGTDFNEQQAKKYQVYPLQESWFPADAYLQISDSRMRGR